MSKEKSEKGEKSEKVERSEALRVARFDERTGERLLDSPRAQSASSAAPEPTAPAAPTLPELPPEHRRPSLEEYTKAGYKAENYESAISEWELSIRQRMAAGESYSAIVPQNTNAPQGNK